MVQRHVLLLEVSSPQGPMLHLDVPTRETCAAFGHVYTTRAGAAPGLVYTTEACAASRRVYTTRA